METLDEFPAAAGHHPGTVSTIDDAFYEKLIRDFSGWEKRAIAGAALRENCRMLLEREARLLDEGRFEEWLELFAPQCVYWVPARPGAGDPRREVTVAFDDRRRLEDRIYRLRTGSAWSQAPASRTVRLVSNVEAFDGGKDALMVRSAFMINEFRTGETHLWAGWCGYRLKNGKIEVKQVNLIDCDQNLRNPSIIF
jgi:3-phenylpropionate/cinnamic acid dioxygenase small subunit